MLICSIALKRPIYEYESSQLLTSVQGCYEEQYAEEYSEAVIHLAAFDPKAHFTLVNFLIDFPPHQTISNYVIATDYLCQ